VPSVNAAPRRRFAERYRRMRTRWNEEWWSIVFGGPIGNLANAAIADIAWITPNRLTWLSFLCKLASAPLLLAGFDIAAVVLFQLHTVLDCMDGSLARYRQASSMMGAFLDKVTDMIGLLAITAAYGWRVYADTGDAIAIVVALMISGLLLVRFYAYWVVAHLERERGGKPTAGRDKRVDYSTLSFRERAIRYAKSMWKIVELGESDLYFWLGLGVVLGRMRETVYALGIGVAIWFVAILAFRYRTVRALDRRPS
jgi:phosphatidylglycerophosphate synthase